MELVTEIRVVRRSTWKEICYRTNWFIGGLVVCILLAFIPVLGWFMSFGCFVAMLWKVFGFREKERFGDCPVCEFHLQLLPGVKELECPVCRWPIAITKNQMIVQYDEAYADD
jgi:hypothetical protein